jgi:hypothetical protein
VNTVVSHELSLVRFPYNWARLARTVPIGALAFRARDRYDRGQLAVVPDDLGIPHMAATLACAFHDLRVLGSCCHVDNYSSGGNPMDSYFTGYLDIHFSAIDRRFVGSDHSS